MLSTDLIFLCEQIRSFTISSKELEIQTRTAFLGSSTFKWMTGKGNLKENVRKTRKLKKLNTDQHTTRSVVNYKSMSMKCMYKESTEFSQNTDFQKWKLERTVEH